MLVSVVELLWPTSVEFGSSLSPALKVFLFVAMLSIILHLCVPDYCITIQKILVWGFGPLILEKIRNEKLKIAKNT